MTDNDNDHTVHRTPTIHSEQPTRRSRSLASRRSAEPDHVSRTYSAQFPDNAAVSMNDEELREKAEEEKENERLNQQVNKEGVQTGNKEVEGDSSPISSETTSGYDEYGSEDPSADGQPDKDLEKGKELPTKTEECKQDSKLVCRLSLTCWTSFISFNLGLRTDISQLGNLYGPR